MKHPDTSKSFVDRQDILLDHNILELVEKSRKVMEDAKDP